MGKDLTEVRSLQRQLVPDDVGLDKREPTSLQGIANRARTDRRHRFQNLYRCIDVELLVHCFGELNFAAAGGVDAVTAETYGQDLESNVQALVSRLKAKRYRTRLVRRSYIPKSDGRQRALGIPALEDKLVQSACGKLLSAIYEEDFLSVSYGYRRGRGAQDAVRELTFDLQYGAFGYLVEADIRGFFDHLDHDWLLRMLEERIDDGAFLALVRKWLKAGVLEVDGSVTYPQEGSPQGGSISPVLANVYLHYALDLWFEKKVKPGCRGEAQLCRYADDFVCAFGDKEDARRFYSALGDRLGKFGLALAPEKTRVLRFSRFHPSRKQCFVFLGFEFYWWPDRKGVVRVHRRTAPRRLQVACRRIKEWVRANRHLPGVEFIRGLNARLRGHYGYFGIRGNWAALKRFFDWAVECAYKWLNRRGGKYRSFTWPQFARALKRIGVAVPRITERSVRRVFA